jgi:sulfur-oxidizing protein SoxY
LVQQAQNGAERAAKRAKGVTTMARGITRRGMLGRLGALATVAALGRPLDAVAQTPAGPPAPQFGQQESVEAAMKRLFGARPIKDGSAVIKLDIPLIAENGAVVPVSVEAQSPMTPQNHVTHIYVIADKNRIPVVTHATLTPEAGQAFMGANIRLGETGDVRAVIEQSDGTLLAVKREVKVTVGGCGG